MKHLLLFFFFIPAALCAQPKLQLNQTAFDLGTIYHGEIKTTLLIVKNAGTDTLTIQNIHTSCGCTSVKKPKRGLLAGESDTLEVQFNSMGFSGAIEKHVTIISNDAVHPVAETVLRGTVTSEIEITPGQFVVWLGTGPIGKELQQKVQLKNTTAHPIEVKLFSIADTSIHADFQKKKIMPDESVDAVFSAVPGTATYVELIGYIETDSRNQPRIPLRIGYLGTK